MPPKKQGKKTQKKKQEEKVMCLKMVVAESPYNLECFTRKKRINQQLHFPVDQIRGVPTDRFTKDQLIRIHLNSVGGTGFVDAVVMSPTLREEVPKVFIVNDNNHISFKILMYNQIFNLKFGSNLKDWTRMSQKSHWQPAPRNQIKGLKDLSRA